MGAPMVSSRCECASSFRCSWLGAAQVSPGYGDKTTGLIPRRCRVERRRMGAPIIGLRYRPGVSFRCPWLTLTPTYLGEDVRKLTRGTRPATPLLRRVLGNGRFLDKPSVQHETDLDWPKLTQHYSGDESKWSRTDPNLHKVIRTTNRPKLTPNRPEFTHSDSDNELTRNHTKWFGRRTDPNLIRTDPKLHKLIRTTNWPVLDWTRYETSQFNGRNRYRAPPIARHHHLPPPFNDQPTDTPETPVPWIPPWPGTWGQSADSDTAESVLPYVDTNLTPTNTDDRNPWEEEQRWLRALPGGLCSGQIIHRSENIDSNHCSLYFISRIIKRTNRPVPILTHFCIHALTRMCTYTPTRNI